MTVEDRVRRVLADAVAGEPPPRTAPLAAVRRRRRRRPVLAGAAAAVLALAVVAGLVAVRSARGPLPATDPTAGWTRYADTARNLQLRYPPGWVLRERQRGSIRVAPPEQAAGVLEDSPPFAVGVRAPATGYYLGGQEGVDVTRRQLPSGMAYVDLEPDPRALVPPPDVSASSRPLAELPRQKLYSIDWGRACAAGPRPRCRPQLVEAGVMAANAALWDRYHSVGELVVGTIAPLTPVAPSSGDRARPACRPDQWRLFHPGGRGYGDGDQRFILEGGLKFLGGRPCHLRLKLRLEVEEPAGHRLPLPGNPATTTVEGDLPEDADPSTATSIIIRGSPLRWYWVWQEWCNKGLPRAILRITAETGARISVPGPPMADPSLELKTRCEDRGRPSSVRPWP
jgi:hypothetical protein